MKNGNMYKPGLLLSSFLVLFIYANAQEYIVKGKLVDSASAKPVRDVTVNFLQPTDKSFQNGDFRSQWYISNKPDTGSIQGNNHAYQFVASSTLKLQNQAQMR